MIAPTQLLLPGFAPDPPGRDVAFFAIFPDATAARTIGRVARNVRTAENLAGRPLAHTRFHISLCSLGLADALSPGDLRTASVVAAALGAPAFPVCFDRLASFRVKKNDQPLVLLGHDGVADVIAFCRQLSDALKRRGLKVHSPARFTPHVTLLYDGRRVIERPVPQVSWPVTEFHLIRSLVGQGRYLTLGRWPLAPS